MTEPTEVAQPKPLLSLRELSKAFGASRALDGVSLDLYQGEVHALVGENGAGKSTLMKLLSGVYRPDSGSMFLGDQAYAPRSPRDARRLGVAMIYQELTIAPHLSVEANILLGQERTRLGLLKSAEHHRLVREVLDELRHPDIKPKMRAGDLSVAGQQLIEVARALISDARVLVFDEPTSSLTDQDAQRLFQVIDRLRSRGLSIVYISHFLEEIQRVAQRYTVLRDGRTVGFGPIAGTSTSTIIAQMVGRELTELFPRIPHHPGPPILELKGLSGSKLPRHVDLSLRRGEVLGLFGLVGAGRTELLRAVYGLDSVRSGQVQIATFSGLSPGLNDSQTEPVFSSWPRRRINQGLGFLSENRKTEGLALTQSIEDNVTYPILSRYSRVGWLNLARRRAEVAKLIVSLRVRIAGPAQAVIELSGGNQQKIAFARILHQRANILLLDEPTRGIDVASKAEIYRMIGELAAQGKSVLMASSYLPELLGVCDRLAVMARGVLSEIRPVEEWTEQAIMEVATHA